MSAPIRVLLADDHTLVRAGIRGLLLELEGVDVVGEASEGHETLRLAESLRPNLLMLDIGLPGLNGLEVAARIAALDSSIRVLTSRCTNLKSTYCGRCGPDAPDISSRARPCRSSRLRCAR